MLPIPPRYEPIRRLGQGGGGEVWAVRDRINGTVCALKVLAEGAGSDEVKALVREAVALSALEGLGVPRVLAFGSLKDGRRYMLRELVEGQSLQAVLEDDGGPDWIEPLARAAEQLTVLHRAGLLHGDIKPANVIVGEGGAGTLVDLGLAAPWKEGGTRAQGLTPRYAAPELLLGAPLTVRAEVYALGATLGEGMGRRGSALDIETRIALTKIAARATEEAPEARYPSVDELASALRSAVGMRATPFREDAAWPVLGLEGVSSRLASAVATMAAGEALAVVGARGSGRTTLMHRLAWALGVEGGDVVNVEAPRRPPRDGGATWSTPEGVMSPREAVELQIAAYDAADVTMASENQLARSPVIVVDDLDAFDDAAKLVLSRASEAGARLVVVGDEDTVRKMAKRRTRAFAVPPLDARSAEELVRRAAPSLPDAIRAHLLERVEGRPGTLRAFLAKARGRAIVSEADIDAVMSAASASSPPSSATRAESLASIEAALDRGRFSDASAQIESFGVPADDEERVRLAVGQARVVLGTFGPPRAAKLLDEVAAQAKKTKAYRAWAAVRARTHMRAGEYAKALELANAVIDAGGDDAIASDALSVRGLALSFTSRDAEALTSIERAAETARAVKDKRAEGVALGSLAIVHQRAGRAAEAKKAYEEAVAAAEAASDAAVYAANRLNLAGLAQSEGDFAGALAHLEAAVDMGRRLGGAGAVQQALLNLANLDLYLGRFARAAASIERLVEGRAELGPNARAQLLGLEAELAMRALEYGKGARLYEACAQAYDAQGRPMDAAEARLEGILGRARDPMADLPAIARELEALRAKAGDAGFREHEALAQIARGTIALLSGDESTARTALDDALAHATRSAQREWAWRALDARARLSASQGSVASARRDTEQALAMLEETAAKLPRDLREVFWDDPRRRALRQAHTATMPMPLSSSPLSPFSSGVLPSRDATGSARVGPWTGLGRTAASGTTSIGAPLPTEDRLARIFEITRELATEHDMDRLLERVTDHAIALLGGERGFVVLSNAEGELEARAARSRKGDEAHAQFSRSVAERVVRTGEPVVAERARDDERLAKAVSVHALSIQSIACVPIRGAPPAGRTIGALYIETRLRPGNRFQLELPTLAAFADQAAVAIENARLLEENAARAEELAHANLELAAARDKLAGLLDRKTEQLENVRRDLKQARAELRSHFGYGGLVGTSAPMRKLYALLDRLKDAEVPVLVVGESGTGKEVVAKALHAQSPRGKRPLLGVNCGAIPANLLESELFGHTRGAFTGADRDKKGLFREAEGGTILLDEIGEMPIKMQASLLRTLQESTVRPLGGAKEEPVDVRVVAATNRDLEAMVRDGTFREDLYYRLHVVELKIPPLRERPEDIPALIDHFLSIFAARYRRERKAVSREALRRLVAHDWPGNVRQLENVLLNAWLMSEGAEIRESDLAITESRLSHVSETVAKPAARAAGAKPQTESQFRSSERDRILQALTASSWNRAKAAKMVGLPRRTFYRRLKEYGILE
jgi:transcriptional regulator with GAF, ATPase, and Fis domain/energy-coupling factor transporter ATP-binding protein EcfA2